MSVYFSAWSRWLLQLALAPPVTAATAPASSGATEDGEAAAQRAKAMVYLCAATVDESQPMQQRVQAVVGMREVMGPHTRGMAASCLVRLVRGLDTPQPLRDAARKAIVSMCVRLPPPSRNTALALVAARPATLITS